MTSMKTPIEETDVERVMKILRDELRLCSADICETIKNSQEEIAVEMVAKGMIGETVDVTGPVVLIKEFRNKLKYEKSVQSLEKLCSELIKIFANIGGATESAGKNLKGRWQKAVEEQIDDLHFLCELATCICKKSQSSYPQNIPRSQPPRERSQSVPICTSLHQDEKYSVQDLQTQTGGVSDFVPNKTRIPLPDPKNPLIFGNTTPNTKHSQPTDSGRPDNSLLSYKPRSLPAELPLVLPTGSQEETSKQSSQHFLINTSKVTHIPSACYEQQIKYLQNKLDKQEQRQYDDMQQMRAKMEEVTTEKGRLDEKEKNLEIKRLDLERKKKKWKESVKKEEQRQKEELKTKKDKLKQREKELKQKEEKLTEREDLLKKKEEDLQWKEEQRQKEELGGKEKDLVHKETLLKNEEQKTD